MLLYTSLRLATGAHLNVYLQLFIFLVDFRISSFDTGWKVIAVLDIHLSISNVLRALLGGKLLGSKHDRGTNIRNFVATNGLAIDF